MEEQPTTFVIRVVLRETDPPVWRRIVVTDNLKLARFHTVLQKAFGWTNSHLHEFTKEGVSFQPYDPDPHFEMNYVPYERLTVEAILKNEGDHADYRYDFGDGWEHELTLEKVLAPGEGPERPACLGGARACPPEDCGGTGGYEELVDAMCNPDHSEHESFIEWLGRPFNPEAFDLGKVNRFLGWSKGEFPTVSSGLDTAGPEGKAPSLVFEEDFKAQIGSMIRELDRPGHRIPVEILKECAELREFISPALVQTLETPERLLTMAHGDHDLPFYAIYLLAEFREKKAHEPLVRMFSMATDDDVDAFGDIVPQDLPRILASTFGGDLAPIQSLVADPKANPWVRGAALEAHITLAANGLIQPSDTLEYLRGLCKNGLVMGTENLWCSWMQCALALHPSELASEMLSVFDDGRAGDDYVHRDEIESAICSPQTEIVWGKPPSVLCRLVENTAEAIAWWSCFHDAVDEPKNLGWDDENLFGENSFTPFIRKEPKVGRNDPCPCGSGKKFKKCCGA